MNIAVILAGGVGNRVGAGIPKQFIEILGKPILAYTIEPFNEHKKIDAILIVCVKPYMDYIWKIKDKYHFDKLMWVTQGGETFQESVINGMNYLKDKIDRNDTVLFHFGASPFITEDIISDVIRVCQNNNSNAISTTDYFLLSGKKKYTTSVSDPSNYTEEYIDRDTVAVMNTPHAFQYGFLLDMYAEAIQTGIINTVEPHTTTLMYAMGKKIYFSKGSQSNIKITKKDDLALFEGYVLQKAKSENNNKSGEVIVFLADGFEDCEALLVVDLLRRAGVDTVLASVMGSLDVKSSRGIMIRSDCLADDIDYSVAKMIFLPGGRKGTANLNNSQIVKNKCLDFAFTSGKFIAAICAAPTILSSLGLLDGKNATCHPDYEEALNGAFLTRNDITVDGNIITGQGLGVTFNFAFELLNILGKSDIIENIKESICYNVDCNN